MNLFIDKKYYDSAIAGDSSVAYGQWRRKQFAKFF